MSKSGYRPLLTDEEMEISFREGATDEEIEVKLRDLMFWSYIMRDPLGKVCAVGRGTRAECIQNAFRLADESIASRSSKIRRTKPAP